MTVARLHDSKCNGFVSAGWKELKRICGSRLFIVVGDGVGGGGDRDVPGDGGINCTGVIPPVFTCLADNNIHMLISEQTRHTGQSICYLCRPIILKFTDDFRHLQLVNVNNWDSRKR